MKKRILILLVLLLIMAGFFSYRVTIKNLWLELTSPALPKAVEYQTININTNSLINGQEQQATTSNQITEDDKVNLPDSYNLNVPFTSQAPFADWNETFKEGCEEASALIVHYFYEAKEFTPQIATDEILKMVDWQLENFGGHFDLTAQETVQMIKEYLGYKKVEVIDNPTVDDIKLQLAEGRPVIIPAAGRMLGNPYFRTPGPIYHMLVIKGYTETQFITNDPGTKRGENFLYDFDVIMEAMHNWNEADINLGEKNIIIIYPKLTTSQ